VVRAPERFVGDGVGLVQLELLLSAHEALPISHDVRSRNRRPKIPDNATDGSGKSQCHNIPSSKRGAAHYYAEKPTFFSEQWKALNDVDRDPYGRRPMKKAKQEQEALR